MRISDWSSDVCSSDLAQAEFDVRIPADEDPARGRSIGTPWLGYAIGYVRGLRGQPRLRVDGRAVPVLQGLDEEGGDGVPAKLPAPRAGARLELTSRLDRNSTRLHSSHLCAFRIPSSAWNNTQLYTHHT